MLHVLTALAGFVAGAFTTAGVQYLFWKRQHRQEVQSLEEREMRKERARAAERWREIGTLLIELSRSLVSGPLISGAEVNTTTWIEIHRLRRALVNATIAAREAFPDQRQLLTIFQKGNDRETVRLVTR